VTDALLVSRDDALHDVARIRERDGQRQRSLVQLLAQRAALEPLHHDVRCTARLPELVNRDDVRMIERSGRFGFALKARDLRLAGRCRQQDFDGDAAFELRVLGEKHFAHAAGANLLDDSVVCDTLPDHCP